MTLLVLGGTADARQLALTLCRGFSRLQNSGATIGEPTALLYSLAGATAASEQRAQKAFADHTESFESKHNVKPFACYVRSGGFSQYATANCADKSTVGFSTFLRKPNLQAQPDMPPVVGVVDATHPYAATMTNTATSGAVKAGVPYWRFVRPPWELTQLRQQYGLQASEYSDTTQLLQALRRQGCCHVLWTLGRMSPQQLVPLAQQSHCHFWVRSIEPLSIAGGLPSNVTWLKAEPRFDYQAEAALFKRLAIDAIVTKNSGGTQTQAKLLAAAEQNIPAYFIARPAPHRVLKPAPFIFDNVDACADDILRYYQQQWLTSRISK